MARLLITGIVSIIINNAYASHFAFGTVSWDKTGYATYDISVESSNRYTYFTSPKPTPNVLLNTKLQISIVPESCSCRPQGQQTSNCQWYDISGADYDVGDFGGCVASTGQSATNTRTPTSTITPTFTPSSTNTKTFTPSNSFTKTFYRNSRIRD